MQSAEQLSAIQKGQTLQPVQYSYLFRECFCPARCLT